jgi:hypothetical protein
MNVIERIADHADIDTRRAMGFAPRKLPRIEFDPRPMPPIEYRYYMNEKKLWYFEMDEYMNFYFEVQTGVELVDPQVPKFRFTKGSRCRTIIFNDKRIVVREQAAKAITDEFQTAGHPIWIS